MVAVVTVPVAAVSPMAAVSPVGAMSSVGPVVTVPGGSMTAVPVGLVRTEVRVLVDVGVILAPVMCVA